jgi:hypothetical protein
VLWYEGGWRVTDLTAATNAPDAAIASTLAALPDRQQVFYLDAGQNVMQLWYG